MPETRKRKRKAKLNPQEPPFPLSSPSSPSYAEAFASVAKMLKGRKKILVLAGAGISVSCGIPDFRTKDKGLYSTLDYEELGLSCPEELFDLEVFQEDPKPFFKFAKLLYFPLGRRVVVQPSESHRFLALLEREGMLLRVYTQNIDGLEEKAGVSPKKMVYAHGSLRRATCTSCKKKADAACMHPSILRGRVPTCRACGGVLKPDVTFFGETLQDKVCKSLESDRAKADALLVIGTSLSVAPMSKVIDYLPLDIPRILINRTVVHPPTKADEDDFRDGYVFDAYMLGFCDDVTRAIVNEMKEKRNREEGRLLTEGGGSVPPDRVLLFPGAIHEDDDFDDDDCDYQEIAHCDGCAKKITGRIHKCVQCFDYDLCSKCYPQLVKSHHGGKHKFVVE